MDEHEWKQYEWLITKIFHDKYSSVDTLVLNDKKIVGRFSNINRQIDALIMKYKGESGFLTIIDCKHYSKKVGIKEIESFIGMKEDVNAKYGIMVSSIGYTSGALKRIRDRTDIVLEIQAWKDAFDIFQISNTEPNYFNDLCIKCFDEHIEGKYIPGILLWDLGYSLEINSVHHLFGLGQCLKCKSTFVWCDSCGTVTHAVDNNYYCPSCKLDYNKVKEVRP